MFLSTLPPYSELSHQVPAKDTGVMENGEQESGRQCYWGWSVDTTGHSRESNFQAMVIPPISESLKRSKKVPSGLLMSKSWACCLFTKPRMALGAWRVVSLLGQQPLSPEPRPSQTPCPLFLTHHSNGACDASSAPP